jgi:hypothetical protein
MKRVILLLFWAAVPPAATAQTNEYTFVTTDIDHFWEAYDASEPGNRVQAFQTLYLDRASPGLREFLALRIQSAAQLAATVDAFPKYYESIRKNTQLLQGSSRLVRAMEQYFSRLKALYPSARIPTVYFMIGRLSTGGTVGQSGLLIGTEVFSLGGAADPSELKERIPAFYKAMGMIDQLPYLVVHESIHAQIARTAQPNLPQLLLYALLEGAADYLTAMVTGRTINDYKRDWIDSRREELFQQFAKDLQNSPNDIQSWLYNYAQTGPDTPADLGYWIGEEICRDYFVRATNKQTAINNIANLLDIEKIVGESSYAWILTGPAPN